MIYATSAGTKASYAYEALIDTFEKAIIDPKSSFCIGLDYRILLEADFLVNAFEDRLEKEEISHFRNKIFKTKTGIYLLNTMFGLE